MTRDEVDTERAVRRHYADIDRQRRLPAQLEAARRKVAMLENEARRYGRHELLTSAEPTNRAWDRAIDDARASVGYPDIAGR